MDKPMVKIENWSVVDDLVFHGYRELQPGQRLTGAIPGNAGRPKGVIYTSVIQNVDSIQGVVETQSRMYQLGRVSVEYERWMLEREEARAGLQWDEVHACFGREAGKQAVPPSPAHLSYQQHHR